MSPPAIYGMTWVAGWNASASNVRRAPVRCQLFSSITVAQLAESANVEPLREVVLTSMVINSSNERSISDAVSRDEPLASGDKRNNTGSAAKLTRAMSMDDLFRFV